MGEVYRARDTRLGRDVAVKLLPAEFAQDADRLARFEREARALAALNHPHIASIHGIEESGDRKGLVLELLDGESLSMRLARGPIPVTEATHLASQLASALDAAHEKGIVHRDLKPDNLQITASGHLKVLDFGLAKIHTGPMVETVTVLDTREGAVLGTVPYMSPEQARGLDTDRRTDIWAFGCILYETLTGQRAFRGDSAAEILAAIIAGEPDLSRLPPDTAADLRTLIDRCLQKDPKQRLRDIGDARHLLDARSDESMLGATRTSGATRRPWWAIGALAAAVVIAAAWLTFGTGPRELPAERISLTIGPPEGVLWGDLPPDPLPAVSPDGRLIAFVGRSADGDGVWVRDLADAESRLLAGSGDATGNPATGGALGLFWSSDSTRVGYCVRGRLKMLSLAGSSDSLDAGCTSGFASWSPSGEILFTRADGLYRISSRGGQATQITTVDGARERGHLFPRWLPDGRFLYIVTAFDETTSGIFIGNPDGSPPIRMSSAVSKAEFVAGADGTGYLVFVQRPNLVALPLDRSLRANGPPRTLVGRMAIGPGALPSFSVSPDLLVHRSGATGRGSAWVWVDRQGRPLGLRHGGQTASAAAALSQDETTLIYARTDPDTTYPELWRADVVKRLDEPFFSQDGVVDLPALSPDGRKVAFTSEQAGSLQVFVMDFPEGQPKRVSTDVASGIAAPSWTPDGTAILASRANGRIVRIQVADPAANEITVATGAAQQQISPDGHWLAFTSSVSGTAEVYVQPYSSGGDRTRVSRQGGSQPQWRGDGRELYYLTPDGALMTIAIGAGFPTTNVEPVQLFRERFRPNIASWLRRDYLPTRDGQRFVVNLQTAGPVPLVAVRNWLPLSDPR